MGNPRGYIAYKQECYGYPVTDAITLVGVSEAAKFFHVNKEWIYHTTGNSGMGAIKMNKKDNWVIFKRSDSVEYRESILGVDLKTNVTFVAEDIIKQTEEN